MCKRDQRVRSLSWPSRLRAVHTQRRCAASLRHKAKLVFRSLKLVGFRGTLKATWRYLKRDRKLREFDAQHGIRTSDVFMVDPTHVVGPNAGHSSTHLATLANDFQRMMDSLPVSPEDRVFVDIGSGMGRAVLLASRWPFQRIIGVEFSQELHGIAEANVKAFFADDKGAERVELVLGDALEYHLPKDPLILYFHQPFDRFMFERYLNVLEDELAQRDSSILVLYCEPRHRAAWDQRAWVHLIEDRSADAEKPGYGWVIYELATGGP
jgi:SAM-dependent methyltransferase